MTRGFPTQDELYLDLSPLFLSGSVHWSSKARPFSLRSAVKLISSLGEDSKVLIRVQGLDSHPALLTATTLTWDVGNGSNPKRWASWLVPCEKDNKLGVC